MPSAPPRSYDYVIGLGANLGSRRANLATAVERLAAIARVTRISALYESEPWGPPQPLYLNAAVRVATDLAPEALLAQALAIEAELGRTRDPALRYGPRTLDLDLLWSTETRAGDGLTLPHPRLRERWFALAPLLDVAEELAPLYADALAATGGRRAPRAQQLETVPAATIARGPSELRALADAPEIEDALADAMTALGRELAGSSPPPSGPLEIESIAAHTSAALVEQALARAESGFGLARAIVTRLDGATCEGRLFGRRTSRPVPLRLERFVATRGDRGVTVEIALSI